MQKLFPKFRLILAVALTILLVILLISACDIGRTAITTQPSAYGILAPKADTPVLVYSPVQIQSAFKETGDITRVELWAKKAETADTGQLLRADTPKNGVVRQEWQPQETGIFTLWVRAYNAKNELLTELTRSITVVDNPAMAVKPAPAAETGLQAESIQPQDGGTGFEPPAQTQPTPLPDFAAPTALPASPAAQPAQDAAITIVVTATPEPSPTPIPRYPPPPPIPGVPWGPTQAELPLLTPPVCDAAQYLGPYVPNPDQRIVISEDDDWAAETVGGTKVHRIWQLRNVGTCTWGPGYELAFYGGRSMGSGGVAFEGYSPIQPERKNYIEDATNLIVPEGKPNQVALLEVVLNVPVTPGVHQSYWRMRNPQGVYFGPIIGLTMEVVRECNFGIYGAPQVNYFEILGVGDVFRPENPIDVRAEFGDTVTLDWSILNAENYDILVREPTGSVTNLATRNLTDRRGFVPDELGRHTVTLMADNGSCAAKAEVKVDVVPPEGGEFTLDLILAKNAPATTTDAHASFTNEVQPGTLDVKWSHFDQAVDRVVFHADLYRGVTTKKCPVVDSIFGWQGHCWDEVEWQLEQEQLLGQIGNSATGSSTVCKASDTCTAIKQGAPQVAETMSIAEHQNLIFCKPSSDGVKYGVLYYLQASKDGDAASPNQSNQVFVECGAAQNLSTEIP